MSFITRILSYMASEIANLGETAKGEEFYLSGHMLFGVGVDSE